MRDEQKMRCHVMGHTHYQHQLLFDSAEGIFLWRESVLAFQGWLLSFLLFLCKYGHFMALNLSQV